MAREVKPAAKEERITNKGTYGWRDGGRGNPVSQLIARGHKVQGRRMLDTGTCTISIATVCVLGVCFWKGGVWRSITHYHPGLSGITVDKVRERGREKERMGT